MCGAAETSLTVSMRMWVRALASLRGLVIRCCHELWCRSQAEFGSGIAVAVASASSCSSDLIPSLGTSICRGCGSKKKKQRENSIMRTAPNTRGNFSGPAHPSPPPLSPTSIASRVSPVWLCVLLPLAPVSSFIWCFQIVTTAPLHSVTFSPALWPFRP